MKKTKKASTRKSGGGVLRPVAFKLKAVKLYTEEGYTAEMVL